MDYVALATELGVRGYIAGKELRARCPIHNDHNPSFSLNIETGNWICFSGCGSGNFVKLVERVQGSSLQEAYLWIQQGKAVSIEQMSKSLSQLLNQTVAIQESDHSLLWKEEYEKATDSFMPSWFLDRGFTWETIFHWKIRYDNLRDAIIVPVFQKGEMIGSITRNHLFLPKYQNSPGLSKNKFLWGEISTQKSHIIISEGLLDALWLWQLGYNVVALLGTYISQEQIDIIKGYRFGEITLALDNDKAGQDGTNELLSKLTKAGWLLPQIKVIAFPPNRKDPQDCTPEEFHHLFSERKDGIVWKLM